MISHNQSVVVAAVLFAGTYFVALILFDLLRSIVDQYLYRWEVRKYAKIQQELEQALELAQRNREVYNEFIDEIAQSFNAAVEARRASKAEEHK